MAVKEDFDLRVMEMEDRVRDVCIELGYADACWQLNKWAYNAESPDIGAAAVLWKDYLYLRDLGLDMAQAMRIILD